MAWVQCIEDAKVNQVTRQKYDSAGALAVSSKIPFFGSRATPDMPHAFVTQWGAARVSGTHFHDNDQFQIIISGKGKLGRRSVMPYSVHFSHAYTPYGPLSSDADSSMSFLVMRPRYDAGPQRLPRELEKLKAVPNRQPEQITRRVNFAMLAAGSNPNVVLQAVDGMQDANGLAAHTLIVGPNVRAYAPNPSRGGGQYLVIVGGGLLHDDKEYNALALVFVSSNEKPFEICAGTAGMQAIVLDFPRSTIRTVSRRGEEVTSPKRWQCQLCGFAYDDALGMPDDGIAPGTHWEDVPASWNCPDCGAAKTDFEMVEMQSSNLT